MHMGIQTQMPSCALKSAYTDMEAANDHAVSVVRQHLLVLASSLLSLHMAWNAPTYYRGISFISYL